ncbi:MAG: Tol-Pal system beta propeller repeat protein TolB [Deltaproteobacteria bacterium]|nr:Tol-Pal system beta propeller repeat protein TolB [Deltaproteobacteria bacterium]
MRRGLLILVLASMLGLPNTALGKVYIDIGSPTFRPFPIAITEFEDLSPLSSNMARSIHAVLLNDLTISGLFEIIEPDDFPQLRAKQRFSEQDYRDWLATGAEALVWGTVLREGDRINVHFSFLDLIERTLTTGRYRGYAGGVRKIVHRMGNDIIAQVTGERGVLETKIAYVSRPTGNKEIHTIDFDGRNPTQITANGSINLSPAWSPGGRIIAFTCFKRRNPDLYLIDVAERRQRLFLGAAGLNAAPAWSPDGSRLALMMRKGQSSDIFLVNRDGSNLVRVTYTSYNEASPTWSPDGKKLAFVSDRTGSPQIYVMDLASKKTVRLTYNGTYNASPDWSPRGDRIAYCGRLDGGFDILTIRPDGSQNLMLTSGAGSNEDPVWSPDGRYIAFSSTRLGNPHLFVMNANGTNQRQLTRNQGGETQPSWSPRME